MPFYAADHQGPRNKATHFIGVTAIAVSLLIPLSWLRIDAGGITVTGALVVTSVLLAYYLLLDIPLGLAMCALFGLALCATDPIAKAPLATGLAWFLVLFIGGWIVQPWGHVYESRKLALVDNLFQVFVAPILLAAEVFFALGYKPQLYQSVQKRALKMRAVALNSGARSAA